MRFRGALQLKGIVIKLRRLINPLFDRPTYASYHQLLRQSSSTKRLRSGTYDQIPKGYLALYVGREPHRFVVPIRYLSHRIFKALLEKSATEFEFRYSNGIKIACEVKTFRQLLWLVENEDPSAQTMDIAELLHS
ncbi:hypothetical protein O6H91_05G105200 [Diphasiastrum complanatum]|uniref:Uncharacterized protein n=1 Tax=Diphasiastrum complanatum TaxID=34168 RepID=A0ACC2DS50_DIPCM|nr:hypothetical protein O6H91_05G105200 [Diphasiastrum complanatum]